MPLVLKKFLVRSGLAGRLPAARRLTDGRPDALRYYSDRVLGAPLDDLLDPATFPAADGPDVMNLNLGAPRFDSPVGGRLAADRSGLPPAAGLLQLRELLADRYRQRDGRALDPAEEVLVTHGATGALATVLDAFVNNGDRVVLFDPCSPLFSLGAKSRRARIRWVPTWDEDGRTRFLEQGLKTALRGAKLLAVADPGNPTGGTLAAGDLDRIAWWADRFDVLIYLDETFARFRYGGQPVVRPGIDQRTLSAGSLTAGYGLGSVRVGWLAGPRYLVRACKLTASLSAPYVPTPCQQLAVRALEADEVASEPLLAAVYDRCQYTADRLRGMGLDPTRPGGGFFCWVPVQPLGVDGREFAERLLKEQRVLVGPGCAYGPSGAGYVRVSFAADDGRLREGLYRLAAFVAGLRGEPAAAEQTKAPAVEAGEPAFSRV